MTVRPHNHPDNLRPTHVGSKSFVPILGEPEWITAERIRILEEKDFALEMGQNTTIAGDQLELSEIKLSIYELHAKLSVAKETDDGHDLQISSLQMAQSILTSDVSMRALKGVQVSSADATDLSTAITLLNEIKLVLNAMNQE